MYHSIHSEFIETPLIEILKEGVQACTPLGVGIHTEPMKEYFLSSLFLRMTGAQEQKLKCICWELATHDYEFRYKYTSGDISFGEMSRKADKRLLYKKLRESIEKITGQKMKHSYLGMKSIKGLRDEVALVFEKHPIFVAWLKPALELVHNDDYFLPQSSNPNGNNYSDHTVLLGGMLGEDYEKVIYEHRNRCAHNLTSYQRCFHSFDRLKDKDYPRQNYVYRFVILILIDEIFIELYKRYKELVERSPWY